MDKSQMTVQISNDRFSFAKRKDVMTKQFFCALMCMAALTTPAFAQDKTLAKGVKAPKIAGALWIEKGDDSKAPTDKDLKGKVLVLEFFAYW
jgi:hypothetical protein